MPIQVRPKVTVLYHYFHPDDVVSARHFSQFCLDLKERGWSVEALPCNRGCRDESLLYPPHEQWRGVTIHRVWRPGLPQASKAGRVLNALWMIAAWCRLAFRDGRQTSDVIVIGTDPVLSVLVAGVIRKLRPRIRLVHWCFDLYPEAPIAEGIMAPQGRLACLLRRLLRKAYQSCDLIADLGDCMRRRLAQYGYHGRKVTLIPWALAEPAEVERPDPAVRHELFGGGALGLLYSGNFGRAHSFTEFLELARLLRHDGVEVCFGVRGNRAEELKAAIRPDDANVRLAGFAPESDLLKRLSAADVHLVSLRAEWSGLVVPSKFFGALAVGRPVLFAGPRDAAIAGWIREYGVGWVLDHESLSEVAAALRDLAKAPKRLLELQRRCHAVYQEHFSRRRVMDEWNRQLLALLPSGRIGGNGSARATSFGETVQQGERFGRL